METEPDAIGTMIKSSPNYRIPTKHHDLLSGLPDELLVNIVSRLCTKDAVQTSILSRRWRNVWKYTHNVTIDGLDHSIVECRKLMRELMESSERVEVNNVQRELLGNGVLHIVKLLSSFQPPKGCSFHMMRLPHINRSVTKIAIASCVEFARNHHVEDFALESCILRHVTWANDDFELPTQLFQISSLVKLKLATWEIEHLPLIVSLPFLRILVLEKIRTRKEVLEGLISSCPSLESLSIKDFPNFFKSISIKNANLKTLHLHVLYAFRLNTPSLELLQFDYRYRFVNEEDYVLEEVSPSFKCQLILHRPALIILVGCPYWKVLAALHRVKTMDFKLADSAHFKLADSARDSVHPSLPQPGTLVNLNCTCMALEVSFNEYEDLKLVAGLLALSPHIKKLVFILKEYGKYAASEKGWRCFGRVFPPCIELEELEIHGFIQPASPNSLIVHKSCKNKIDMVKLLTKKSKVLKKITVHVDEYFKSAPSTERHKFSRCLREIQCCQRDPSSPIVKIVYL